jgi:DNA (cytosine-5)-methyltransferase 1
MGVTRAQRGSARGRAVDVRVASAKRPTCIDLFSGAGGLADGFRQAGWKILAAVDNDRHAAATFRHNFPDAVFFEEDVARLEPRSLLEATGLEPGELDCLAGGPPCQSFSYNNHARSASGRRARLFRHYLRIVETIQPKTLVMENVPGILTIGRGKIVSEIRKKLLALGYEVGIRILYTEDFGVPQERRRVFVVATRLGWEDSLFPRGSHGPSPKPAVDKNTIQGNYIHRWEPPKGKKALPLVTVWDAISDLPKAIHAGAVGYTRKVRTSFQRRSRGRVRQLHNHVCHSLSPLMLRRIARVPEGGNWLDIPRRLLPAGMRRAKKKDHTKRYGRLARARLCSTILTKCDPHWGSYVHPIYERTITVREAARLQSFRDSFQFVGKFISKHYEQVGNAVPPLVAKSLAHSLKRHISRKQRAHPANVAQLGQAPLPRFASPSRVRSENMRAIRGKGNRTTERRLRALLSQSGVSGWTETRLRELGSPDFAFLKQRVLVFVDGCFWHGCDRCGHVPKTNAEYWTAKIERNRSRDNRVTHEAKENGYSVVRLWECELRERPQESVNRIRAALEC